MEENSSNYSIYIIDKPKEEHVHSFDENDMCSSCYLSRQELYMKASGDVYRDSWD